MMEVCHRQNSRIKFEVGTEESIRRFTFCELSDMMHILSDKLSDEVFSQIKYLVIQSGTSLNGNNQTGTYNSDRLLEMIRVCKQFNVLSKEHNGDYIPTTLIKEKFHLGLDAINIAPEFGLIETQTYIDEIRDTKILDKFWKICHDSKRWVKWVNDDFDPIYNKKDLIKICGHYVLSNTEFITEIKSLFPDIDDIISYNITKKLKELYE
jgi:hypothetical protein